MAVNEPYPLVVNVEGMVAIAAEPSFMVIVEVAANPVPETVTVEPTGPFVGLRVMDGATV